jgi:PAS domain S-box-containing protein
MATPRVRPRIVLLQAALAAIPLAIGLSILTAQRSNLIASDRGIALMVVANVALITAIFWWHARSVHRAEEERLRSERALRDSEALYHSLVETLPQNIFRKDVNGRFTFANQRFCLTLGKPLAAVLDKTDYDFFPKELAEKYRRDDLEVIRSGKTLDVVEEHVRPSGERLFVQVVKTPICDARGTVLGMQGIFWDVSDRHRAEEELARTLYLFDALMDNVPDAIYFKDATGCFTRINRALADWLSLPGAAQALGKTDFDFFPAPYAQAALRDEQEVLRSGQPLRAREEYATFPNGSQRWVLTTKMSLHDRAGQIVGSFGISRDITMRREAEEALKASERRYRQLTESSQDGIVVADQRGRIILFNPAAERIFGFAAAEVVGQPLTRLMPSEFADRHRTGFERFLQTRVPRLVGQTVELPGRRQQGSEFPLELSLSAIDLGGETQFLGSIRDLSERTRLRAMLVQSEKLASIGLLSAGIAHEINNPLAFVANNLVVLERDLKGLLNLVNAYDSARNGLPPATLQHLERLTDDLDLPYIRDNLGRLISRTREGVQRVANIVQSLRNLARTTPPVFQEAHLGEIVVGSLEMVRGGVRKRGIAVQEDLPPALKLWCVPTQLTQVLLNLFVNAMQAIDAGDRARDGVIHIAARQVQEEVVIEVTDNGCGISPDDLPRLFDPFFTTKPVGEGTGLGLSITHSIVAGHGGRIEVHSQPGDGSCFRVVLPINPKKR